MSSPPFESRSTHDPIGLSGPPAFEAEALVLGSVVPAAYTCEDESGVARCSGTVAAGAPVDTSRPGEATFSVEAEDLLGNATTVTVSSTVVYRFDGFTAPVSATATNVVQAGRTLPLKWRLAGEGIVVADPASVVGVTSRVVACDASATDVEVAASANGDGLQYLGDGYWQYNWATERGWSGSCRQVVVRLADETAHVALIQFR